MEIILKRLEYLEKEVLHLRGQDIINHIKLNYTGLIAAMVDKIISEKASFTTFKDVFIPILKEEGMTYNKRPMTKYMDLIYSHIKKVY